MADYSRRTSRSLTHNYSKMPTRNTPHRGAGGAVNQAGVAKRNQVDRARVDPKNSKKKSTYK